MTRLPSDFLRATRIVALVAAGVLTWSAPGAAREAGAVAGAADAPLFETRVRSVSIEGASLASADVHVEMALRASRNLTVRRLSFSDSSVEGVPVWIDEIAGEWRLRSGQDFLLPDRLRARVSALDVLQSERLARAVQRRSVTVRTTVEVDVAAPWSARLFFGDPTRAAIVRAEVQVPIDAGSALLQPVVALTAALGERLRDGLGWLVIGLRDMSPARRALIDGLSSSMATVTVDYELDMKDGERRARTRRALAFAWDHATLCTTHEALEPWRFDVFEAAALQAQGARLAADSVRVSVAWQSAARPTAIDSRLLRQGLPPGRTRSVYTPVDRRVRRVTIADRESPTNIVCLAMAPPQNPSWRRGGLVSGDDAAAFVPREPGGLTLAWTGLSSRAEPRPASASLAQPTVPLTGASFGSPLVSSAGLHGIVIAERQVALVGEIERAAARAVAVNRD